MHNRWRCPDDACKKSSSIRTGSFFEKSKLSLQQWIIIIHWWVREYPVTKAGEEAKTAKNTAIQSYQYLRDICSWRLTSVDSPLLLGGQGVVVQIDESLFRHKPKVNISLFTFTCRYNYTSTYICSIIVDDQPILSSGCLEWWTLAKLQPWG